MTNRREFLQIGISASAWPFVARGAAEAHPVAQVPRRPPALPLLAVVYDPRFEESVKFARRAEARGVRALAVRDGDMTSVWYDEVQPHWRRGPAAIAGLTAEGPMFCFTELARDVRMRVVFRAVHQLAAAGLTHAFTGPASMIAEANDACRRAGSIGAEMADIVTRCPVGPVEIGLSDRVTPCASWHPGDTAVYTWLIAPAGTIR